MKGQGDLSFRSVKLKGLTERFLGCEKSRKLLAFVIFSYLKDSAFTTFLKMGYKVLNSVCERGTICQSVKNGINYING